MGYSRDQKKWAATRRAQFALDTALRRIDFQEDVIAPELAALAEGRAQIKSTGNYATDASEGLGRPELEAGEVGE